MTTISRFLLIGALSAASPAESVRAQPFFTRILTEPFQSDRGNSSGAAWVDYDGDDDLDLFVANRGNQVNFLYRNHETRFIDRVFEGPIATDTGSASGVCWADYDNNGALDVFLAGFGSASMLYQNLGGGDLQPVDLAAVFGTNDLRGWACSWGDIDLDGYVDLIITHPAGFVGAPSTTNHFFRNRGDGTFEAITGSPVTTGLAPYTVPTFSDFDMDGDPDLFIGAGPATGTPGPDFLYRNMLTETGNTEYERITEGPIASVDRDGQVINWIDYDNDRDFDAYITNWGGSNNGTRDELFRNDAGILVPVEEGAIVTDKQVSLSSVWADFDNDGDLDVYVTDGSIVSPNRYYQNEGRGSFTRIRVGPAVSSFAVSWGATAGDYDGDGDLDLYISNIGTQTVVSTVNFLYRNDLDNGNHWLRIKLEGTASNRAAIGAKVHAKATISGEPIWQLREVSSQNSFNGHNSLFVHFGLGDATSLDSLVVEWPSGQIDSLGHFEADQFLLLVEGETPASVANEPPNFVWSKVILEENYPNPFNVNTVFRFTLPDQTFVSLHVIDLLGRVVARPLEDEMTAGRHEVDMSFDGLPGGVYVYRFSAGYEVLTGALVKSR